MVSIMLNVLLSMIIGIIRNPLYYVETAPEQPALNSYSSADIQREIKFTAFLGNKMPWMKIHWSLQEHQVGSAVIKGKILDINKH